MSKLTLPTSPAGVRIIGTGLATPAQAVTNDELAKTIDTNDEWIVQRTGIRQRYICKGDERCSTLATKAAKQAIENASLSANDIDLVIAATMTPDMVSPTVSCQVVSSLGMVPCGAMDINLACTGFVAGLNMAANFIRSGMYRNIVLVGAEQMTSIVHWDDRAVCVLFGDGAGAAVITGCDNPDQGCFYQKIHSDGTKAKELYLPRLERDIVDAESFNGGFNKIQMNGREVFKFAVTTLQRYLNEAMEACGLKAEDVKYVIPHQSNLRIIEAARDRLGFREDQVYVNIDRYGNTSAASVGICLHELTEEGKLTEGDIVIFIGVGAGVTWATSVWQI